MTYPNLWKRGIIQRRMYQRAEWRCEQCGMEFVPGSTRSRTTRRRDGRPFVLTIHHITGDKRDCSNKNLVALCQRCHLYVQWRWQPGQRGPWITPPDWITQRGWEYLGPSSYQLELQLFHDLGYI